MQITPLSPKGCFSLSQAGQPLLTATYEKAGWQALTTALDGVPLTIQPQDNWQRTFYIQQAGAKAGTLTFQGSGESHIHLPQAGEATAPWILQRQGFTKFHFALQAPDGPVAWLIKPTAFDKKLLRFAYEIEPQPGQGSEIDRLTWGLVVAFGINLYKAKQDNMEL